MTPRNGTSPAPSGRGGWHQQNRADFRRRAVLDAARAGFRKQERADAAERGEAWAAKHGRCLPHPHIVPGGPPETPPLETLAGRDRNGEIKLLVFQRNARAERCPPTEDDAETP